MNGAACMTASNSTRKIERDRLEALTEKLGELAIPPEIILRKEPKERVDAFLFKRLSPEEKRLTVRIEDPQDAALRALAEGKNGAELGVLELLAALVVAGQEVNQEFQRVANAIVTQSVLLGKLPSKPRGRPKDDDNDVSRHVASDYYAMRDAGASYAEAVAELAAKYHKDERHIMRLARLGRRYVWSTKSDREKWRDLYRGFPAEAVEMFEQRCDERRREYQQVKEDVMRHDFIGELDDLIDAELDRMNFTDMKSP